MEAVRGRVWIFSGIAQYKTLTNIFFLSFSFLDDEYITSKPEGLVLINLTKNKSDILLTQDDTVSVISFTKKLRL